MNNELFRCIARIVYKEWKGSDFNQSTEWFLNEVHLRTGCPLNQVYQATEFLFRPENYN